MVHNMKLEYLEKFTVKQLRERQNALRYCKFTDNQNEEWRLDELEGIVKELVRKGSKNPGGSMNPVANLEES